MMACLIVDDAHTRLRHLPHALHIKVGGAHVLHLAPLLQAGTDSGGGGANEMWEQWGKKGQGEF